MLPQGEGPLVAHPWYVKTGGLQNRGLLWVARAGRTFSTQLASEIRELLTDEAYAELLRRMVQVVPNGPLLDSKQAFGKPSKN